MRINGEISIIHTDDDEVADGEERENEMSLIGCADVSPPPTRLVVGYALTCKKKTSFLQPKLLALAR